MNWKSLSDLEGGDERYDYGYSQYKNKNACNQELRNKAPSNPECFSREKTAESQFFLAILGALPLPQQLVSVLLSSIDILKSIFTLAMPV